MKNILFSFYVKLCGCLPASLRILLSRGLFEAAARRSRRQALIELFQTDDHLNSCLDATAMRYGDGVHPKHRLTRYHDFFAGKLTRGETVLDIGCGYGAVADSMAQAGAVVTGIDVNPENIRQAQRLYRHPNLTFLTVDATRELPRGSWQTVVLSNVLEHIEDRVKFLASIQSSVKPRRWLIRVPMENRHWHVPLRRELGLPWHSDPTHCVEYTRDSFEAEMKAAGLSVNSMEICWGEIWAEARHA